MDLNTHYQSYRAQVQRDAFPDYAEYAAELPTKDPDTHPTVMDYLKFINAKIQEAVINSDEKEYLRLLPCHQEAALALFTKMYEDERSEIMKVKAFKEVADLDMAEKYGWRALKFTDTVLKFENFVLIPRYAPKFKDHVFGTLPCVNADEMETVMKDPPPAEGIDQIIKTKRDNKAFVTSVNPITMIRFKDRNNVTVCDWTGRLYEK